METLCVAEPTPPRPTGSPIQPQPQAPRLLDQVRGAIRRRHFSRRTEEAVTATPNFPPCWTLIFPPS